MFLGTVGYFRLLLFYEVFFFSLIYSYILIITILYYYFFKYFTITTITITTITINTINTNTTITTIPSLTQIIPLFPTHYTSQPPLKSLQIPLLLSLHSATPTSILTLSPTTLLIFHQNQSIPTLIIF